MKKKLYIYDDPFIVDTHPANVSEYCYENLTEDDRHDLDKINTLCLQFALYHGIINGTDNGDVVIGEEENMGSWIWMVSWMNFRSLVVSSQYHMLLSSLSADRSHPVNLIIDFHSRLGTLFDHRILNTLVNRTIGSVSLIPYNVDNANGDVVTWDVIHKETPFLWVIILLQAVIRSVEKSKG